MIVGRTLSTWNALTRVHHRMTLTPIHGDHRRQPEVFLQSRCTHLYEPCQQPRTPSAFSSAPHSSTMCDVSDISLANAVDDLRSASDTKWCAPVAKPALCPAHAGAVQMGRPAQSQLHYGLE